MSDSDIPKPPPSDDFSKTTPNTDKADWGKTNYKYPAQPPAEDWGNTVANVRHDDMDFGKTFMPGSDNPKTPDWGITQGNIRLPNDDFGATPNAGGGHDDANYGATTPYFRLPEAERAKYQNVPLTPTQEAAKQEEEKKKGGIPPWVWVSGGLFSMFLFAVLVLLIVYIFVIKTSNYEVVVKDAPLGSSIHVDGSFWAQTQPDGTFLLTNLKAGEKKKVEIVHPNWICQPEIIDGTNTAPIRAKCTQVKNPVADECIKIKAGAYDVAEKCANKALDELSENFSVDDLLRAMNFYIIQFAVNKYDIPPKNMVFLERAAGYMKKLPPNVKVEVGGHTDSDGTNATNQPLSENRAKAVREALVTFGVNPEMLTEKGYGAQKPVATNDTPDGKFQNRRIEYTAVKK